MSLDSHKNTAEVQSRPLTRRSVVPSCLRPPPGSRAAPCFWVAGRRLGPRAGQPGEAAPVRDEDKGTRARWTPLGQMPGIRPLAVGVPPGGPPPASSPLPNSRLPSRGLPASPAPGWTPPRPFAVGDAPERPHPPRLAPSRPFRGVGPGPAAPVNRLPPRGGGGRGEGGGHFSMSRRSSLQICNPPKSR
ncbi:basic proline-rich protein-like isoform X3 [Fukomys damarensis]|uniref:basic proline-rich protein-like isoform X3 n=1 Tax=Fukomys damarensis TaxID=885580 RepID=UPI00053F2DCD|nr:basic proline-rich protein-like isoform X3 [Fukomys damarensis]